LSLKATALYRDGSKLSQPPASSLFGYDEEAEERAADMFAQSPAQRVPLVAKRIVERVVERVVAESTLAGPDDEDRPEVAAMMRHGASSGYVRSSLTVLHGGAGWPPTAEFDGALAVSAPPEEEYANHLRVERIRTARIKGYEGDSCEECGNFTLIRNGTWLKCDTAALRQGAAD
jgi:hypothetical protein